jgi:hypothetical protein
MNPATFIDHLNRAWTPRVTVKTLARVERDFGIGILEAAADPERLRVEVLGRVGVVARLFWLGVADQARARGLTETQVGELLSRDGNFPKAARAVGAALADFFRPAAPPEQAAADHGDGRSFTRWLRWPAWLRGAGRSASSPGA